MTDLTPLQIFALVFTYLVFGYVGYRISRKFKRPVTVLTWIGVILATILAMYVMPHALLIGLFEFEILISNALQAIGLGIIIGLVTREMRLRMETKNSM
jgi:hypothetical protein